MKVGYSGTFIEVHNGRVPNHTQLRYTFNAQRAGERCVSRRWHAAPVPD